MAIISTFGIAVENWLTIGMAPFFTLRNGKKGQQLNSSMQDEVITRTELGLAGMWLVLLSRS
jgi:hypothetical protein